MSVKTLLATDGYLDMVVAKKCMHIESGKKLRQFLSSEAHVTRLIDVGNTQLCEGRTTYTCILYLSLIKSSFIEEDDFVQYQPVSTLKDWINQGHNTQHYRELPGYLVSPEDAWLLPVTKQE